MQRRDFLASAGGMILTSGMRTDLSGWIDESNEHMATDIAVIGAGIFGVWSAFYLQKSGARVVLIDAYGPGNSRSSSGGETRILRSDYGERMLYSRLNIRAFELWKQWQEEWNEKLMLSTGRLTLGIDNDSADRKSMRKKLLELGVESELIDEKELKYRWPQINSEGLGHAVFFPGGAGGSALMARESCRVVAREFVKLGGKIKIAKALPGQEKGNLLLDLGTNHPYKLSASKYIFACGPWMPRIFPVLFKEKLKVYRRDVLFVGTKAGDNRFSYPNFPIWSFVNEAEKRYYGMPDIDGRGLKVAPWPDNNTIDMDTDERLTNPIELKRGREFVAKRFPALKDQPFIETRVCQLTFSEDEHFIIDKHPAWENVWLACAGSGHAFKHGPALGEYISQRVFSGRGKVDLDEAFRLKK